MEQELNRDLFDPGMTHIHRVGLAGLHMTLRSFDKRGVKFDGANWETGKTKVTLNWEDGSDFPEKLLKSSFGIAEDGLIQFAAHQGMGVGDLQRIQLHNAILGSFLQHNKQNKIPKSTARVHKVLAFDDKRVAVEYRPLVGAYAHMSSASLLVKPNGKLIKSNKIKGWLLPGAAERHSKLYGTEIVQDPARLLCLLFAPVAAVYYQLSHRNADGKWDKRRGVAVVFPHFRDLNSYFDGYRHYRELPVEQFNADSLEDAGLHTLLAIGAEEKLADLGLDGCSVVSMGKVAWSSQQQTRTGTSDIEGMEEERLDEFDLATRCLANRVVVMTPRPTKKDPDPNNKYFVATSYARGLIAKNVAAWKLVVQGFRGSYEIAGTGENCLF